MKIIAAYDDNRCIGNNGTIPWNIPEDLRYFKKKTVGNIVVMGRKTWQSLPVDMLPERHNFVLTRTYKPRDTHWALNLSSSLHFVMDWKHLMGQLAWFGSSTEYMKKHRDVFIIGGWDIYKQALEQNLVDTMYITKVHGVHRGDVYFPLIPQDQEWSVKCTKREDHYERLEFTRERKEKE